MSARAFADRLLEWFERAGRKHLPWQQSPTPYRVWVSEIMLQQTQVSAVIPYFERFMQRFADVQTLAAAPLDEVLHLWTGLGYYARARNLHRAAQYMLREHGGAFPATLTEAQALPGVGRSTAGAILSLACGQRHAILDGNVKRVLARHAGIAGFPGEKKIEAQLWRLAEECTPDARVAQYTQAIMDLGATVCTRAKPRCESCPVREDCVARRDGLQSTLPTPRPKRMRPQRMAYALVALNDEGAVLLERRPPTGIWGGLWTFPQFEREDELRACFGLGATAGAALPVYHHTFTHFDLELRPWLVRAAPSLGVADGERHCWYDPKQPKRIGLAAPVRDIIEQVSTCPVASSASY